MFNDEHICIIYLLLSVMVFCASTTQHTVQNGDSKSKLSRQRRYLIFPTGSSVQLGNVHDIKFNDLNKNASLILNSRFFSSVLVYEFGVTIPDYTLYVTTGITVALAWNLPDKPAYPEHVHIERIENGSLVNQQIMIQNKNDTNSNASRLTYLNSSRNDIFNRIANYAEYYFQNRPIDSYYFGLRNSSFRHGGPNRKINVIRPPYSTIYSENPSNDAMYMIERYFKPWIESSLNRIKSPGIPSKSMCVYQSNRNTTLL